MKEYKDMTDKELVEEIDTVEWSLANTGVSKWGMMYAELLWREASRRGLEINEDTKYTLS